MKNNLITLIKLSEIDTNLTRLKDAKIKLPLIVIEIQNHLKKFNNDLAGFATQIESLQKQKSETSDAILEKQNWIQSREALINDIKTTKEYQAQVKEIAAAKKDILDKTTLLQTLDTQIESTQKSNEDSKALILPKMADLESKLQDCQAKIESVDPKIQDKQNERDALLATLAADIQTLYTNTQKRINPALAHANNKICSECGNRVAPQIINQLMASSELQTCTACHRILYLDSSLES